MSFEEVERRLRRDCAVAPGQTIVLGFSGGPDSLALLHALCPLGQPLIAAHLDHALRPASAAEAERAGQMAEAMKVPFITERAEVAGYAKEQGLSVEEAARELRYRFLFRVAAEQGAAAVAVAHHADDQVETVLMHLLRGAGMAGLRGMAWRALPHAWSETLPLVRPLLGTWRQEILEYCAAHRLDPIQDPSNQERTYFRNQLRHELTPQLERLAPGFKRRLAQSADLLAADYELIAMIVGEAWQRCLVAQGEGYLQFAKTALLAEPLAAQRGLLRRALAELRPAQSELDFASVQRALELIEDSHATGSVDWTAGLYLLVEGDSLWIADRAAELPVDWPAAPEGAVNLEVPVEIALNVGWQLKMSQVDRSNASLDGFQAQLDLDRVGEELVLRRPRPGDRFQPLGMARGRLKLSDFFINEKLPQRARRAWPLVCRAAGDEIVWVPGHRLAHAYRLQEDTKRVLEMRMEKK